MYYKIVLPDLTSYSVRNNLKVQYRLNEFVEADSELFKLGYGLAVFADLQTAKYYFTYNSFYGDCLLFECEVEEVVENLPKACYVELLTKQAILENSETSSYTAIWPNSTVLVKAVKLTKQLTKETL